MSLNVRTLVIQSATITSQYFVLALVDLPDDSTCAPGNVSVVTDASGKGLLFNWTIGTSGTSKTYITKDVGSALNEYVNIYIAVQDADHKGTLNYGNPVSK